MKLIIKVMPNLKHFISTEYKISNEYYKGEEMKLAGTGQGNKFSRDIYRDISYLIIRQIELKNLGVIMKVPISQKAIYKVAVVFVDNIDLVSGKINGGTSNLDSTINKIQELIE